MFKVLLKTKQRRIILFIFGLIFLFIWIPSIPIKRFLRFAEPLREPDTFEQFEYEYNRMFYSEPPAGLKEWFTSAKENQCFLHPQHYRQIKYDLSRFASFAHKITLEDVNNSVLAIQPYGSVIILGVDGHNDYLFSEASQIIKSQGKSVYIAQNLWDEPVGLFSDETGEIKHEKYSTAYEAFQHNACLKSNYNDLSHKTPFFLSPTSFPVSSQMNVPYFSQAKPEHCYSDIIWIDHRNGPSVASYLGIDFDGGEWSEWANKKNKVVWRGSNTGGIIYDTSIYALEDMPRMKLIDWSHSTNIKEKIEVDIALNAIILHQGPNAESINNELREKYPHSTSHYMSIADQFKSKYLIVVDGNTWPGRLSAFLMSGSVILLATIFIDWVTINLEPWVHYVPIKMDMSDLDEKLQWLINHDKEAEMIGKRGRDFALRHLRYQDTECYKTFLALEYAELF